jgi:hypothetical protein
MTWKQLDARFTKWFLKCLSLVAALLLCVALRFNWRGEVVGVVE